MKQKKATLSVTYEYEVRYGHEEHLRDIIRDLKKRPVISLFGAGEASDGKNYSYSCEMVGEGEVADVDV